MALSYTQQQKVMNGEINPPDMKLMNLLGFIAVDFAIEFRNTYKIFDLDDGAGNTINQDAQSYKNAIFSLCSRVLNFERNRDGGLLNSFTRNFVSLLARTVYAYPQLEAATQQQWENFIKTGNPASGVGYAGIRILFETVANTTREGRDQYDNPVVI